jgi:Domain of unknown function (DUF5615)
VVFLTSHHSPDLLRTKPGRYCGDPPQDGADSVVLKAARDHGCVLVTCNWNDFIRLAELQPHHGIVVVIRRLTRVAERAALFRRLERAGDVGLQGNINVA